MKLEWTKGPEYFPDGRLCYQDGQAFFGSIDGKSLGAVFRSDVGKGVYGRFGKIPDGQFLACHGSFGELNTLTPLDGYFLSVEDAKEAVEYALDKLACQ